MDRIVFPEDGVASLDAFATGIQGLRITFVNVFGINHADGTWTLLDAGLPFSESLIRTWAEKHFHQPPNCIVLTHGHFDHVSAAKDLADYWNVPIYAHPLGPWKPKDNLKTFHKYVVPA